MNIARKADEAMERLNHPEEFGKADFDFLKEFTEDVAKTANFIYGQPWLWGEEWEKTFDAVETALGIDLFIWQKEHIVHHTPISGRRCGKSLAEVLYYLLNPDALRLNFSDKAKTYREQNFRGYVLDIKKKLNAAGVTTREVIYGGEY